MLGGLPLWVCAEAVDFRLGIDGLALRVQGAFGPTKALTCAHVFFNRGRDKVKILRYDRAMAGGCCTSGWNAVASRQWPAVSSVSRICDWCWKVLTCRCAGWAR
jgi:hypothetical protein